MLIALPLCPPSSSCNHSSLTCGPAGEEAQAKWAHHQAVRIHVCVKCTYLTQSIDLLGVLSSAAGAPCCDWCLLHCSGVHIALPTGHILCSHRCMGRSHGSSSRAVASLSSRSITGSYDSTCGLMCFTTCRMPGHRCMVQGHRLSGRSGGLCGRRHPEQHAPGHAQRRWRPRHLDGLWRSSRHRRYTPGMCYSIVPSLGGCREAWAVQGRRRVHWQVLISWCGALRLGYGLARTASTPACLLIPRGATHQRSLMARVLLQWCSWCGTLQPGQDMPERTVSGGCLARSGGRARSGGGTQLSSRTTWYACPQDAPQLFIAHSR